MPIRAITAGLKLGRKLYAYQQKYKYLDPTEKFITKFVPPGYRNKARIAAGLGVGGSILYDIYELINNGFQSPEQPQTGKQYQKRGRAFRNTGRYNRYNTSYGSNRRRQSCTCRPTRRRKRMYY